MIKSNFNYDFFSPKFPFRTRFSILILILLLLAIPLTVLAVKKVRDFRTTAASCGSGCSWPDLAVSWSKNPYYLIEWCVNTTQRGSVFCDNKNKTGGNSATVPVLDDWKVYWWVDTLLFDPHPTVRWKNVTSGSITKNCGGGFRSGVSCNHNVTWGSLVHTARAFHRGTLNDACNGGPASCISTRSTTGKNVTFRDLPANQRFDVYVYIKGFLFESLPNKLTGSCSCATPPPQVPPSPGPTTGPISEDPNVLVALQLKISAPYLVGKTKIPLIIGGRRKQIEISGGTKTYRFGVSKDKFLLGQTLHIVVGGNNTLRKTFTIKPKKAEIPIKVGRLFFGDVSGDNKIDESDKLVLQQSIGNQTGQGDLNADGVSNSLDWAVLLANFGRVGKF